MCAECLILCFSVFFAVLVFAVVHLHNRYMLVRYWHQNYLVRFCKMGLSFGFK